MRSSGRWIILVAITQHLFWGVLLWGDASPMNVTALHRSTGLIGSRLALSGILLMVGCLAWVGLRQRRGIWRGALLVPQQFVLMMSLAGAVIAISLGQFGDGVQRSRYFIAADQCPVIMIAVCYVVALANEAFRVHRGGS